MSFSEPGKFFDKSPGDSFQGRPGDSFRGRPGDSFDGGAFKARAEAKNAESHARHERWKQEKTDKAAAEAHEAALSNMADMAKSNAEGFASLVGQFRAMMELCYPDLVKLCNQQVRMDSSELFPAVACISENGPEWRRPLPEGGETGEALVWDDELAAWVPGEGTAYGFEVTIDADGKVQVKAGTAQFWGGAVKRYAATTGNGLGSATDGHYVYAVLNIESEPPAWNNALAYGEMTGQDPDTEIWIPIAQTSGSNDDGWAVTQLHWGNIVIPAVTTAVDVQTMPPQ